MVWNMYKKELKMFLRNPFQIAFMLVAPIALVLIMGYAMSNIVGENSEIISESEEDTKVLYMVEENVSDSDVAEFDIFQKFAEENVDVTWEEVKTLEDAREAVDSNDAIALIQVSEDGFYYYRSPYNEPASSKVLRAAYNNMMGEFLNLSESKVTSREIEVETVDSYTYFTFAELGLIMLYISLIVGQSVFTEKDTKAFRRIYISKANVSTMLISKIALGVTIGVVQIAEVYLVSTYVLDVNWGSKSYLIALTYLMLALFSSTLGAIMAIFAKSRAAFSDKILILSLFVGLLGGGLTPLSFLGAVKVLSYLCKISPLYWIVNGSVALAGNQSTIDYGIGMAVCIILTTFTIIAFITKKRKEQTEGVFIYE